MLKSTDTNVVDEWTCNMVTNPNWQEAEQLAVSSVAEKLGVKLRTSKNNSNLLSEWRLAKILASNFSTQ